jgi:NAD-dependent dihydropyrimidine dehydrogenase PreA subunit
MRIEEESCLGCGRCADLCPQEAIRKEGRIFCLDQDLCLECGLCLDTAQCPSGALTETFGEAERVKKIFGRMVAPGPGGKKESGRLGSLDLKTCDAKGGLPTHFVQVRLELGRPLGRVPLGKAEAFKKAMGSAGYPIKDQAGYASLLISWADGEKALPRSLEGLSVLSVVFEADLEPERLEAFLSLAFGQAKSLGTGLSASALMAPSFLGPSLDILGKSGWPLGPRAKTNLGLAARGALGKRAGAFGGGSGE